MTAQSRLQQQTDGRVWLRCPAPVTYVKLGEGNGIILDIGEGGLGVKTLGSFGPGHLLQITFPFSKSEASIETKGRIAWRNEARKMTGVEFVDLPGEAREQIREWVSSGTPEGKGVSSSEQFVDPEMEAKIARGPRCSKVDALRDEGSTSSGYTGAREIPFPVSNASAVSTADSVAYLQKPSKAPQVAEKTEESLPAGSEQDQKEVRVRNLLILAGCLVLISILVAAFFEFRSKRPVQDESGRAGAVTQSRLGLRIEPAGRDWRLSWNPDAQAVETAKKGSLSIIDGSSRRVLDLDPSDLRSGTVMYTPLTGEVALRLEVVSAVSQATTSESIRITSGAPVSALPTAQAQSESRKSSTKNGPQVNSTVRVSDNSKGSSSASTASLRAAPPTPAQSDPEKSSTSASLTEAKPSAPSGTTEAEVPPSRSQPTVEVGAPSNSKSAPPPPAAATPSVQQSVVPHTSQLEAAQLISRTNPVYPPAAREARIAGTVVVRFQIGADGKVHDVIVVSGNTGLAEAAVEAVRDWRYKPAKLGGNAVESEGSAMLEFQP